MKRVLTYLLGAVVVVHGSARADRLVEYDLAGANASVSDTVEVLASAPEVQAQELTAVGELSPPFFVPSTFMHQGWPSAPVPDPDRFYEFSLAPRPGHSIEYDSLSLAVASGGGGTGAFQLTASLDGFATPGQVLATRSFPKDASWHAFDLPLAGLGTQQGEVTFRFSMYLVGPPAFSGLGVNPAYGDQGQNLVVSGTVIDGEAPAGCTPGPSVLCIDHLPGDRRFRAQVSFETSQGSMPSGAGRAIPLDALGIPSGGIFWFTNPENPEMLLKVLDGCAFNQHHWVFYAAGTNFALRTEVIDTATGAVWSRTNPDRTQAPPVGDILAFPCSPGDASSVADSRGGGSPELSWRALGATGAEGLGAAVLGWTDPDGAASAPLEPTPRAGCSANANTLCVDGDPGDARFEATVFFRTSQGSQPSGFGTAIPLAPLGVPSGGVFWFTNPENPEMLLKVLDGCAFNQHYWVFYAAGTNFGLDVEVVDTETGARWTSMNPDRRQAPPIGDLHAFPCS